MDATPESDETVRVVDVVSSGGRVEDVGCVDSADADAAVVTVILYTVVVVTSTAAVFGVLPPPLPPLFEAWVVAGVEVVVDVGAEVDSSCVVDVDDVVVEAFIDVEVEVGAVVSAWDVDVDAGIVVVEAAKEVDSVVVDVAG